MSDFNLLERHNSKFFETHSLNVVKKGSAPTLQATKKSWLGRLWDNLTTRKVNLLDTVIKEAKQALSENHSVQEVKALSENLKLIIRKETSNEDSKVRKRLEGLFRIQVNCEMQLSEKVEQEVVELEQQLEHAAQMYEKPQSKEVFILAYQQLSQICDRVIQMIPACNTGNIDDVKALEKRAAAALAHLEESYEIYSPNKILCYFGDDIFEVPLQSFLRESNLYSEMIYDHEINSPAFLELHPAVSAYLANPSIFKIDDQNLEPLAHAANYLDMPFLRQKCDYYLLRKLRNSQSSDKQKILDTATKYQLHLTKNYSTRSRTREEDDKLYTDYQSEGACLNGYYIKKEVLVEKPYLAEFAGQVYNRHWGGDSTARLIVRFAHEGKIDQFSLGEAADLCSVLQHYPCLKPLCAHMEDHFAKAAISYDEWCKLEYDQRHAISHFLDGSNKIFNEEVGLSTFDVRNYQDPGISRSHVVERLLSKKGKNDYTVNIGDQQAYVNADILDRYPCFTQLIDRSNGVPIITLDNISENAFMKLVQAMYYGTTDDMSIDTALELYEYCSLRPDLHRFAENIAVDLRKLMQSNLFRDRLDLKKNAVLFAMLCSKFEAQVAGVKIQIKPEGLAIEDSSNQSFLKIFQNWFAFFRPWITEVKGYYTKYNGEPTLLDQLRGSYEVKKIELDEYIAYGKAENPFWKLTEIPEVEEVTICGSVFKDYTINSPYFHLNPKDQTFSDESPDYTKSKIHTVRCLGSGQYILPEQLASKIKHLEGNVRLTSAEGALLYKELESGKFDLPMLRQLTACETLKEVHVVNPTRELIPIELLELLARKNPHLKVIDVKTNWIDGDPKRIQALMDLMNSRNKK